MKGRCQVWILLSGPGHSDAPPGRARDLVHHDDVEGPITADRPPDRTRPISAHDVARVITNKASTAVIENLHNIGVLVVFGAMPKVVAGLKATLCNRSTLVADDQLSRLMNGHLRPGRNDLHIKRGRAVRVQRGIGQTRAGH